MIYTLGYNGWSVDQMAAKVAELDAWLADVRFSPRSQRPEFDQSQLRASFPTYVWVRELGNRAYKDGRIDLADPARGVEVVRSLLESRPVILLCACPRVESCHRRVAAEVVARATGAEVEHLLPPGRARDPRQELLW